MRAGGVGGFRGRGGGRSDLALKHDIVLPGDVFYYVVKRKTIGGFAMIA